MSFKISWKLHINCFLIGFTFCLMGQNYINNLILNLLLENKIIKFTGNPLLNFIFFIFIIFIAIIFFHELLHGATYKIFGTKVKYGFKIIYAYVQETSGIALHRTKFLIVLLAPVTIISIASIFIAGSIGDIIFLLNLLGSIGDLLMAFYLCKSNENSYIIDTKYGFDVVMKID
ncbi:MAG: DUF3267 domain-containing protein [Clostridiaceae bacterium]